MLAEERWAASAARSKTLSADTAESRRNLHGRTEGAFHLHMPQPTPINIGFRVIEHVESGSNFRDSLAASRRAGSVMSLWKRPQVGHRGCKPAFGRELGRLGDHQTGTAA